MRGLLISILTLCFLLPSSESASAIELAEAQRQLDAALKEMDEAKLKQAFDHLSYVESDSAPKIILFGFNHVAGEDRSIAAALMPTISSGIQRIGTERFSEPIQKYLLDKRTVPFGAAVVIMAFQYMEGEETEKWLLHALDSRSGLVVRNAIDALVQRRSKNAIPAFIDILEKTSKVPNTNTYVLKRGLIALTGVDLELIADWKNFWEANKNTFDPWDVDRDDGTTKVVRVRPASESAEFFGVDVVSDRVVFLIDVSGSMKVYNEDPTGRQKWQQRQRITRVKKELSKFIKTLKKGSKFNIISFGSRTEVMNSKGLVPAAGKHKKSAQRFIKKLRPEGVTRTDLAFAEAFKDPEVDTIILLSDGSPYYNDDQDGEYMRGLVLRQVRDLNRIPKVTIFTLGFDERGKFPPNDERAGRRSADTTKMVEFLKALAKEHGGSYTSIK